MVDVALVNMPFAAINRPSLGLAQLRAAVERECPDATVRVCYPNIAFGSLIGSDVYNEIAFGRHYGTGLGDWLFRAAAFPDADDEPDRYFRRYYPHRDPASMRFKERLLALRDGIEPFVASVIDDYALDTADIVGFTSMFAQTCPSLAVAAAVKRRRPETVVVMGGANCEGAMGRTLVDEVPALDAVFSGPALVSLPAFVRSTATGSAGTAIDGVLSSRQGRRQPVLVGAPAAAPSAPAAAGGGLGPVAVSLGAPAETVGVELPLDEAMELDFDDFFDEFESLFADRLSPVLPFETSRGCWWGERSHCTFCGLNGANMGYRAMTPDIAVGLINRMFERYGHRCNRFASVDNIMARSYVAEVLPRLRPAPDAEIFYEVKANLSAEDVLAMADARITTIQPGIESLSTEVLRLMRKGSNAFTNVKLLKHCIRYGVVPEWNILVGFPGESDGIYEKYLADLPLLHHLTPPSGAYPVRFDRFSPYFENQLEYGLALEPSDFYGLVYPFPAESLRDLAYYFSDDNLDADYVQRAARHLPDLASAVAAWLAAWDRPERPQLTIAVDEAGVGHVTDTRGDEVLEYELDRAAVDLLRRLEEPTTADRLVRDLGDDSVVDRLAAADELRLLFREGQNVMGLGLLVDAAPTV